jgi:hypothetical protein
LISFLLGALIIIGITFTCMFIMNVVLYYYPCISKSSWLIGQVPLLWDGSAPSLSRHFPFLFQIPDLLQCLVVFHYIVSKRYLSVIVSYYTYLLPIVKSMGWTVQGSNPGGGEIFRTCPDRPWGPPSLLYYEYRVFPGCKERPGRDADPSPPSSAMVRKE